jgi:hypothetical protein
MADKTSPIRKTSAGSPKKAPTKPGAATTDLPAVATDPTLATPKQDDIFITTPGQSNQAYEEYLPREMTATLNTLVSQMELITRTVGLLE